MRSILPRTVAQFLEESSMHGLRYLVLAENPLVRLLWLASISFSVGSSAVIIYLNVVNWNNSPAVVTNVRPTPAKGQMFMPMVTVCPHYPSNNNLLFNLLKQHPDYISEKNMFTNLDSLLARKIIDVEIMDRYVPSHKRFKAEKLFDPCNEDEKKDTEECEFVILLSAIGNAIRAIDKDFTTVQEFIYDHVLKDKEPTLVGLQDYVEDAHEVALDDYKEMPRYSYHYENLIALYTLFFPVFKGEEYKEFDTLKKIGDFVRPNLMVNSIREDDFASLIAYMVDRLFFFAHYSTETATRLNFFLASAYFDLMGRHLGVNASEVQFILTSFAFDPVSKPLFVTPNNNYNYSYPCPDFVPPDAGVTKGIIDFCNDVVKVNFTPPDVECWRYCKTVVLHNSMGLRVRELNEMALHDTGALKPGYPHSLLPVCQFQGMDKSSAGCWHRIITDQGICYSSYTDGSKRKVAGIGEDHSFKFSLDVGGTFHLNSMLLGKQEQNKLFDIMLTPPDHYSIGLLTEKKKDIHRYDEGRTIFNLLSKVKIVYVSEATDEFQAMNPTKRHCLYPDELKLDHFSVYSESNCVLECAWEHARDACQCVPWFLHSFFAQAQTCEAYGNRCFRNLVENRYGMDKSLCAQRCLPDCETVEYEVEYELKTPPGYDGLFTTELKTPENELYYDYVYIDKANNTTPEMLNILKPIAPVHFLESVGLIRVFIDKKSTLKIVRTATVTIIDMISNIGGTLGLFCGVSILSAVELVYWIGRVITKKRI